jgi:hypothetical protein
MFPADRDQSTTLRLVDANREQGYHMCEIADYDFGIALSVGALAWQE